ncbi:TetR/AcrR family transcriptional regulator [Thermoleptolyngbya sichuanensis A183]|uniref:TetR/AcrR family transcriptional regulator n=1 Tax=Thermoleptolyngbya sichuanensis A183 TaxID=2737172 RepID=A0A6M8BA63_9CYAN|nr:TetR/AcrR family transcriptional regulator [Thermoleptolyngbya sichuanensis]QKD81360.1 TetR/AcrR family transcriptional regulator [Thermoleptolyngbya sichuanensis A183]
MPKIVDHEEYRKELLSKCFEVIAEKGYNAVTMRQIAQRVGVSTGTLYHYFPSKESLFEQLVGFVCEQDSFEFMSRTAHLESVSERLRVGFELLAEREEYFQHQTLMMLDFARQLSLEEVNCNETLQGSVEGTEQGIMHCLGIDDIELVRFLGNFVDGLLLRRLYVGDRTSIPRQAALLGEMLQAYLASKQAAPTEPSVEPPVEPPVEIPDQALKQTLEKKLSKELDTAALVGQEERN